MKFANKLFFTMTALLTAIFAVFGLWMLSSYSSKAIEGEIDRAKAESGIFLLMFENEYSQVAIYGEEYAVRSTMENIAYGIEKNGNYCMIWNNNGEYYCNSGISIPLSAEIHNMGQSLMDKTATYAVKEDYYGVGIREIQGKYYIITITRSALTSSELYLGMCRDITEVYTSRQNLITRYCVSLGILLLVGGFLIFILSRYITRPIRNLNSVVKEIAGGNYEKRCMVKGNDEIGTLAENFNEMTNTIVDHMHQKELEAMQKESFTVAFSHELKTPLTSIIGYADMLNTIEMTDEERREAYYYIYSQGKRLECLSHKLLELAEIDNNLLRKKQIPANELEENMSLTMRPIFEKKKIEGTISMETGFLYADKDLVLSVFYNLLDNAVKAVKDGGKVSLIGTDMKDGYEIIVKDNGRGIPEKEISRITEAFYMVDKSRSRKEGGAGIGMTLCQKIINLHNATMQIHSKLGEGTVIQLIFPGEQEEA